MKKVIIVSITLVLIGLSSCGKKGGKYVGKYVYTPSDHDLPKQILNIKANGTYTQEIDYRYAGDLTTSGRWEIVKGKILLHDESMGLGNIEVKGELRGNKLIDQLHNKTFIRQD